jgi:hypothetical protein
MEPATLVALAAMFISLFLAVLKYLDRRKTVKKEQLELTKKQLNADVERESIVIRGAEGALLLMEKTLNTTNIECERRINELEEENEAQRCEIKELRKELKDLQLELRELTRRVNNG